MPSDLTSPPLVSPLLEPPATPDTGRNGRVGRSLAVGVLWNSGAKALGQAAAWASTLVVARLLSPDDYGVFGMASFVLGLLQTLAEFGIGTAVVIQRDLRPRQIAQLNTTSLFLGLGGMAVACAAAPLAGWFFGNPKVTPVLAALSVTFLIGSVKSVPWALLQRDLRFKRLAAYEGFQALLLAACTITLAAMGARHWTLVGAAILSAVVSTGLALRFHAVPFAWPSRREVGPALSLGGDVVAQRLAWYAYSNADFVVAGRMLGTAAAGAYTLAWTLANIGIDKVAALVLQVTPPILAAVKDDRAELTRYVVLVTQVLALAVFPIAVGLALVAPEFVVGVLGAKWTSMVPALQLLSAYASIRVVLPLFSQTLITVGDQRFATRMNVIGALLMPAAFVLGARWGGITGIAAAWVIAYPVLAVPITRRTLGHLAVSGRPFFRSAIWPAFSACVVMAVGVELARLVLPDGWPALARLAVLVGVGGCAYLGTLATAHLPSVRATLSAARALRST